MTEKEYAYDIRDVTKLFLKRNRWSISNMSLLTRIPQSTLSDWLSGKSELTARNRRYIDGFLNGDYIKDVSTVVNNMLIMQDHAMPEMMDEDERILSIRDITKEYLETNLWSLSDMAFFTNIPRYTLDTWLSKKNELSDINMQKVKNFLGGKHFATVKQIQMELKNNAN